MSLPAMDLESAGRRTDAALAFAHDVLEKTKASGFTGDHIAVAMFIPRATSGVEAVRMLVRGGYNAEAFSLVRTLVELDIDLAYIVDADTANRMTRFWEFDAVRKLRRMEAFLEAGGKVPADLRKKITAEHKRVAKNYAKHPDQWCAASLEKRATKTKRRRVYLTAYAWGSGALHSGPEALKYTTKIDRTGLVTSLLSDRAPMTPPQEYATTALLRIAGSVADFCRFDFKIRWRALMEAHGMTFDEALP